ncbi:Methyltransferase domain-containing protein [Thermosyntropha lipolytica DSM 11003]|uniref:Methyltransferase domain-containing protein n=1 Tax=Thermosyntropha lipolytica DSM 11003 TaxID=1123382 RepID=A0A1M5PGL6_9FIRM|nr:class I SAM-dependent methyltransferase [Thermosyntropha lipolytica]SHH00423.1 Methyltransferase domain-containing protein [Thermosyntropha lipolytica DSM 11003]
MILKEFFTYYFSHVDDEVRKIYAGLLPQEEDLAGAYAEMFSRHDEEALKFLLDFYSVSFKLCRENPRQAILFNVNDNVCFDFFLDYVWNTLTGEEQDKVFAACAVSSYEEVKQKLKKDVALRNWFRREIGSGLDQEELFTLNEVISLQNFSSGGESSFLQYVYPRIKDKSGRVLDGGCGAGFATLVMSQYMEVYSLDACQARLKRAHALAEMMKRGERKIFPQIISLIQKELGGIEVEYEFPDAEKLLNQKPKDVHFTWGSLDKLPYEDNFFHFINCLDVLEHTYDPEAIVKEFARVLRPGGQVFITAPTRYGEWEQRIHESIEGTLFPAMLHMHHFDQEILRDMFSRHGLREVEVVPFDFMTYEDFLHIAEKSPDGELAEDLKQKSFDKVALQLFAVYEKI